MGDERNSSTEREDILDKILAEYLQAVEAGQPCNRRELLARYPELAAELNAFFADEDRFDRLAELCKPSTAPVNP
jgi:hypothetical protein